MQINDRASPAGHNPAYGGANSLPPRPAGAAPEYDYSPALAGAGFTWTPELLDRWLANPPAFLPGTEMEFILESAEKRADVIAYLIAAGTR